MALVLKDRVRETSTSTGTGAFTLSGAVAGFQSFSAIGTGNSTYYTIATSSDWEVGIGTWTSPNQLSRDTILASTNGGAAVNFGAGTKDVFVTYPAEKSVNINANNGDVTISGITLGRGANQTSVDHNLSFGLNALSSNTTSAYNNTAIGDGALAANTDGVYNVGLGTNTLAANIHGVGNLAIGTNALAGNTNGNQNVAIGNYTLINNNASFNIAIGGLSLYQNNTGFNNVAIGANALNLNTTGQGNIAVGFNAMLNNNGINNTALGVSALEQNLTGGANIAIGGAAMQGNLTGGVNVGIGFATLQYADNFNNIAIGYGAATASYFDGVDYLAGTENTIIGVQAGNVGFGNYNVLIGTNVAYADGGGAAAKFNGSTIIGAYAGYYLESGDNNTCIGANAGKYISSGSNNVIVGSYDASAAPVSGTGSNYVVLSDGLGNVRAYYDGASNAWVFLNSGSEKMRVTSTGNIYGTSGSTTMTNGFFYIPSAGGAPTGTPTAVSGHVPMYYDTTNNQFYVYNGAWKKVALI